MKKAWAFIQICLYILAVIGGIGYLLYLTQYAIAVALAVVAVMAFPAAKKALQELMQ